MPEEPIPADARYKEVAAAEAKERQREAGKTYGRGKVPAKVPEPIPGADARDVAGKKFQTSGKTTTEANP